MEMHAIQSKQASISSGCIVGKPETEIGLVANFRVARQELRPSDSWELALVFVSVRQRSSLP